MSLAEHTLKLAEQYYACAEDLDAHARRFAEARDLLLKLADQYSEGAAALSPERGQAMTDTAELVQRLREHSMYGAETARDLAREAADALEREKRRADEAERQCNGADSMRVDTMRDRDALRSRLDAIVAVAEKHLERIGTECRDPADVDDAYSELMGLILSGEREEEKL